MKLICEKTGLYNTCVFERIGAFLQQSSDKNDINILRIYK